jgi:hypothetical protein
VAEERWDLYATALIAVDVAPGGVRSLRGPQAASLPAAPPIFVLTAYNPNGIERDPTQNVAAEQELERELDRAGVASWPAVGRSPDGAWAEPGVAVAGIDRAAACAYGRSYGQLAVFEVTDREVHVVRCADAAVVRTSSRRPPA